MWRRHTTRLRAQAIAAAAAAHSASLSTSASSDDVAMGSTTTPMSSHEEIHVKSEECARRVRVKNHPGLAHARDDTAPPPRGRPRLASPPVMTSTAGRSPDTSAPISPAPGPLDSPTGELMAASKASCDESDVETALFQAMQVPARPPRPQQPSALSMELEKSPRGDAVQDCRRSSSSSVPAFGSFWAPNPPIPMR